MPDRFETCPTCGADFGESETFPWHYADEDCRSLREPEDYAGGATARAIVSDVGNAETMAYREDAARRREAAATADPFAGLEIPHTDPMEGRP